MNANIQVHALELPEVRETLKHADVIFGVDVDSEREFVVYGKEVLQRIVASNEGKMLRVARVELDQDTHELEYLLAAVRVLRGHDDYQDAE